MIILDPIKDGTEEDLTPSQLEKLKQTFCVSGYLVP